ncbi:MAG: flagellar filament capping protein FliD [Cyanobacteria bacterium P01_H01_bin.74]
MGTTISGFAGFNSGLPIDDIVAQLIDAERAPIRQLEQRQSVIEFQRTEYDEIEALIQTLHDNIEVVTNRQADGTTLFDEKVGVSSDETVATATVTGQAAEQTIDLEVITLPRPTRAASTAGIGVFDTSTTLAELNITAGNFQIYANGTPYTFTVATTDTIGSVLSAINTAIPDTEIASDPVIADGRITFNYLGAPTTDIDFGSGGDTSNFLSITHLLTAIDDGAGTITASQRNSSFRPSELLSSATANLSTAVTDGTFIVNGVTFDTTGQSLNDVIAEINASATANATASYNSGNNTFILTSRTTGSPLISLEEGTSNFLSAMNLVSGADTTTSQTQGTNSQFILNGATMYATGTTVDETLTGLTGVTLDLRQSKPGTTVQITVGADTEQITSAIQGVVDAYNEAISLIDQRTDGENGGVLAGEGRLKGLRNDLRTFFTSQVSGLAGTPYDSLQQAGISTGAIGSTVGEATAQLTFDSAAFLDAFSADENSVKLLFTAQDLGGALDGSTADDGFFGTFTQIENYLSDSLYIDPAGNNAYGVLFSGTSDNDRGLFAAYDNSARQRIEDLEDSIQRKEDQLAKREETLRRQFISMDSLIGQFQSQESAIAGLTAQLNNNNQ